MFLSLECVAVGSATRLLQVIEPYLEDLEFVLAPLSANDAPDAAAAQLPPEIAGRVRGHLWDRPPPCPLARYEHLRYWLRRTYVTRVPTWLALDPPDPSWPTEQRCHRISCSQHGLDQDTIEHLGQRLKNYIWSPRWWGPLPGPSRDELNRMTSLMVAWSVDRSQWSSILGESVSEFATRLDLLLDIHAGALQRVAGYAERLHWMQLPSRGLDGRRPLDVIREEGLAGIRRVHRLAWD